MACCTLGHHPNTDNNTPFEPCAHSENQIRQGYHKKRLIVCCDGTWNNSNDAGKISTNVGRLSTAFAQKCCTGMPQVIYYHRGAGTDSTVMSRMLGGLFGYGVVADISDVYRFVSENYSASDEIVFIGFSRGAFTARSVAGMICGIGLLNGFGLANFGAIFEDYSNFSNWKWDTPFDEKLHLQWFTRSNRWHHRRELLKRKTRQDPGAQLPPFRNAEKEEELIQKQRVKVFKEIIQLTYTRCLNDDTPVEQMKDRCAKVKDSFRIKHLSDVYQFFLYEYGMALDQQYDGRNPEVSDFDRAMQDAAKDPDRMMTKVRVKAVGVWDTVGSLGIPYDPRTKDRSKSEIRFASHDVDPRIENAFHALALDETRGPFKPTLWNKLEEGLGTGTRDGRTGIVFKKKSRHDVTTVEEMWASLTATNGPPTKLRQVWFPGNHSDVGGGLATQQIATISLAWMADQLSSVGVEFNPAEMERIFSNVGWEGGWGLGRINTPAGWTGTINNMVDWDGENGRRTPGINLADGKDTGTEMALENTHELIHPSVRIRYMYGGKGPDDGGDWACKALTDGHYMLHRFPNPGGENVRKERPKWAGGPDEHSSTFETLHGAVTSIPGGTSFDVEAAAAAAAANDDDNGAQQEAVVPNKQAAVPRPHAVVPKQLPYVVDLYKPSTTTPSNRVSERSELVKQLKNKPPKHNKSEKWRTETDGQPGPVSEATSTWVWHRETPDKHDCKPGPGSCEKKCHHWLRETITLHEERIGMWERQFMEIVSRGPVNLPYEPAVPNIIVRTVSGTFSTVRRAANGLWKMVKGANTVAAGVVYSPVYLTKKTYAWYYETGAASRGTFESAPKPKKHSLVDLKAGRAGMNQYGFHDFIVWQQGDARTRPVPPPFTDRYVPLVADFDDEKGSS